MSTYKNGLDETVRFRIEPRIGTDGIYLELKENGNRATTVFPPKDAPSLALAILEAAGVEATPMATSVAFGTVVADLQRLIAEQERATAEARERAELEAEALGLAKAGCEAVGDESAQNLSDMTDKDQRFFLAVARRAREMSNEKKVNTND